jgi:hypothetical protein
MPESQEEAKQFLNEVDFGDGAPDLGQEPPDIQDPDDPVEPQEPAPAEPREPDAETMAREIGWRPKSEWRDDPAKWIDAETYLQKGEKIIPVMKRDREKLFREVADVRQQLKDFQDYHKKDRERVAKREYERGLAELEARQLDAVESGDTDAFKKTKTEREALEQTFRDQTVGPQQDGQTPPPPAPPQSLVNWQKDNTWFGTDEEATAYARTVSDFVLKKHPQWIGDEREFFDAVKGEVKRMYPAKFSNQRRRDTYGVESNEYVGGRGDSGRKSFNDLPPEARAECAKMERAGLKRADFVAEYFGTNNTITFND